MYEKQKPFDQIKAYSCLYPSHSPNDKTLVALLSKNQDILWFEGEMAQYKTTYIQLYLEQSRKMKKDCNALRNHLDTKILEP